MCIYQIFLFLIHRIIVKSVISDMLKKDLHISHHQESNYRGSPNREKNKTFVQDLIDILIRTTLLQFPDNTHL